MTVKELREALAGYPDDMEIIVNGTVCGYNSLDKNDLAVKKFVLFSGDGGHLGAHKKHRDFTLSDEEALYPQSCLYLKGHWFVDDRVDSIHRSYVMVEE